MSREKQEGRQELRQLSTPLTWWFKFAFPAFAISLSTLGTLAAFFAPSLVGDPEFARWIAPGMLIFFCLICRSLFRLKKVHLASNAFHISNFITRIEVPFTDVEQISGFRTKESTEYITLHLRRPTRYGAQITFIPMPERPYVRSEIQDLKAPPKMVPELQRLIRSKSGSKGGKRRSRVNGPRS